MFDRALNPFPTTFGTGLAVMPLLALRALSKMVDPATMLTHMMTGFHFAFEVVPLAFMTGPHGSNLRLVVTHILRQLAFGDFLDPGCAAERRFVRTNSTTACAAFVMMLCSITMHMCMVRGTTVCMVFRMTMMYTAAMLAILAIVALLALFAFTVVMDATTAFAFVGFLHNIGIATSIG